MNSYKFQDGGEDTLIVHTTTPGLMFTAPGKTMADAIPIKETEFNQEVEKVKQKNKDHKEFDPQEEIQKLKEENNKLRDDLEKVKTNKNSSTEPK